MPTVVQLPTRKALTVRAAADAFLDSLGNPNTVRSYQREARTDRLTFLASASGIART
ncbi:hypothetical protein Shyhy01_16970 [Streptomyces hygroscopicus subsp. hygroscopicus]|nr:hypothetical protein [Streptomyces hygroscopicus]GLX48747.1 hypothetical protein Shyhy01_16970 [Streptomyces hygroscopicus subsp. hygroscopicus]